MADEIDTLIAGALKIPLARVSDDLGYASISEWGSLAHVNLMLHLEAKYGVEIDEEVMVELLSVRDIKQFIFENA